MFGFLIACYEVLVLFIVLWVFTNTIRHTCWLLHHMCPLWKFYSSLMAPHFIFTWLINRKLIFSIFLCFHFHLSLSDLKSLIKRLSPKRKWNKLYLSTSFRPIKITLHNILIRCLIPYWYLDKNFKMTETYINLL